MRQILFHIPLDRPVSLGPLGEVYLFGVLGLFMWLWMAFGIWATVSRVRHKQPFAVSDVWSLASWAFVGGIIFAAPWLGAWLRANGSAPFQDGLPLFGYGFMLFVAVATGGMWAAQRAEREGLPREKIWDLAFCLFLSGIAGARLFYLVQYRDRVFQGVTTPQQFIVTVLNLSNGGIVLYGGLIAAAVGFFAFCWANRIRPLAMLDIIAPSIFLGIGFGRIGCFLNGCCYGDRTSLPWGVQFPRDSATFGALVEKKLLDPAALCTPALHPTQIYSAIDGFIIAAITAWYFSRRRRNGEVFAIGLTIYPITRFLIEFIRGDEPGLFGSRFTISQWISAGMFLVAMAYIAWLSRRPLKLDPITDARAPANSTSPKGVSSHSAALQK
jgi:phosphatidylglycerol:prolipoprotein diacylglycerol transferase